MQEEIPHFHAIGRGVVVCATRANGGHRLVIIDLANLDRVHPEGVGHMVHHPLDPENPLRSAKAAIGGGGLGIGLEPVRGDPRGGQEIGVVGMEHGAVGHRDRQIKRPAAAGVLGEIDAQNATVLVIGHIIVDPEIVPLAGDGHVVVAIIAHLGGAARLGCHHGAGTGQRIALAFLAAKAAAHPAGLDPHGVHWLADRLGDLVLDLGRVLGRGMDDHIAVVLREDEGSLAFEIEMLLPTHFEPPLKALRGGLEGIIHIALGPDARALFKAAVGS